MRCIDTLVVDYMIDDISNQSIESHDTDQNLYFEHSN